MSKKKVKGKTLDLNSFLTEGGNSIKAGFTVVQKKNVDWTADDDTVVASLVELGNTLILPTAPMSSRGGLVDESKVPRYPPFTAHLGNLPFEVTEEDISAFFEQLKIKEIRLTYDSAARFKGFGHAEFEDRSSLIGALNKDGEFLRNRPIKVTLADDDDNPRYGAGGRREGGFSMRGAERLPERDLPSDWRAAARDEAASVRASVGGYDRYGGERDLNRDWRSGGGYERDYNRGGFQRYESASRSSGGGGSGPSERPRLNLTPRSKPIESAQVEPEKEPAKPRATNIFGAAKPVDTAAKEREIEKRLQEQREREREQERATNNNDSNVNNANDGKGASGGSWREESREEREKRDRERKARISVRPPVQQDEESTVTTSRNKFADLESDDVKEDAVVHNEPETEE